MRRGIMVAVQAADPKQAEEAASRVLEHKKSVVKNDYNEDTGAFNMTIADVHGNQMSKDSLHFTDYYFYHSPIHIGARRSPYVKSRGKCVSVVQKKDADISTMRDRAEIRAQWEFDDLMEATSGLEYPGSWESLVEKHTDSSGNSDLPAARREYMFSEWNQSLRQLESPFDLAVDSGKYFCMDQENPREVYVKKSRAAAFAPMMIVVNDKLFHREAYSDDLDYYDSKVKQGDFDSIFEMISDDDWLVMYEYSRNLDG